jgi:hypothetical protein
VPLNHGHMLKFHSFPGVDVVKGALKAGRTSRGGSTDEGYQAGDFLRGLGYAMSETTKSAAQKRREERKTGHEGDETLIDFAVGATAATGEYISENKAKLGGAGAAGVGMVVGTMVAGPLGGVVGGILSGATTNKAIDTFDKKYGKQSSSQGKSYSYKQKNEQSTHCYLPSTGLTSIFNPLLIN